MKLNSEIKTAHLLAGVGLCIILGIVLAYFITPRLFVPQNTALETSDLYKLPESPKQSSKPILITPNTERSQTLPSTQP